MRSFFKTFFAALLALIIFSVLVFFLVTIFIGKLAKSDQPAVHAHSVLVLDLGHQFKEQMQENPLALLSGDKEKNIPGLYDVVRLLREAKNDKRVEGIFIKINPSSNGFAASEEIRNALLDFKESGKFIIAQGDIITQKSYSIANVADRIYVSPQGFVEWKGMSVEYAFLKGTLEKLDIEPQIFYAGKFKSATEPFRSDRMTDENKLQTSVWINDLYTDFLQKTAEARNLDTAVLRQLAVEGKIQTAKDAKDNKLVDDVKYDDEVKDEMKKRLNVGKYERLNFISISNYMAATKYIKTGGEKIALIYAEGNIVDGKGDQGSIGSETYRTLVRKARLDKSIKAIVFRINSGGGSALASENIWRELALAKEEKPVVVSFGDVAASGGYYVACAADSIFAQKGTITGSIGVFGIIPNMQAFFKNKLGVTFDGVSTGPFADAPTVTKPMNEQEKKMLQAEIENIYGLFKKRVAEGRRKDTAYIETIAQGRVWTGIRAKEIGLIDRFGGIDDAVRSAAAMAKLGDYTVSEYPEPQNVFDQLFGKTNPMSQNSQIKEEIGEDYYKLYQELKRVKEMTNKAQTRMPFEFFIR
ncbi:MAG TPA: signal peptide peptidase SppA [Chitinophagaceae bacterium]